MGFRDSYVFIARKGHANNIKEKLVKRNEGFAQIEMAAAGQPLALYWFGPGRAYDPMIGRWLSVDRKAQWYPSHSPYNFTLNNPINNYDRDGNFVLCASIAVIYLVEIIISVVVTAWAINEVTDGAL